MIQDTSHVEEKIKRMKRRAGFIYGLVGGASFAITLWGMDGYLLSQAHAYFPWLKLTIGILLTAAVGGLAGWLVSHFEKTLLGLFFWFVTGGALAWLAALVPIVLVPAFMGLLEPDLQSLLHYTIYDNLPSMVGVTFAWISIAVFIVAAIQIPLIEQAVFGQSVFSRVMPHIVCAVLMLVNGAIVDNFHNQPLRDPIISLDRTIQFSVNNRDREVDPKTARELHVAALRPVQSLISNERRLVVGHYDPLLENVTILINFNGAWVECGTIFTHPLLCRALAP